MTTQYGNQPDSLCGNDDCGQMSAWYIFNAIGFYPVAPGSNNYVIGTPLLEKATIDLGNGKKFTMRANNISEKNSYIQDVKLNGKSWNKSFIPYSELENGGELIFKMSSKPNKKWATNPESVPPSISK